MKRILKQFLVPIIFLLFQNIVFCSQNRQISDQILEKFNKIVLSVSQFQDNIYYANIPIETQAENQKETEEMHPNNHQTTVLYELIVKSQTNYEASLLVKDSNGFRKIQRFNSFMGFYYLSVEHRNLIQIQLVLEKINIKQQLDSQDQSEAFEEAFFIKSVRLQNSNYCPFECFNNGSCSKDNTCICNNNYESSYFCYFRTEDREISINQVSVIVEESKHNQEDKYQNFQQLAPKKEKICKLKLKDYKKLSKIYEDNNQKLVVKFNYQKRQIKLTKGIQIFHNKQLQKILLPEQNLSEDVYESFYEVDILNILLADQKSKEIVSFLEDCNIYNLKVLVTIQEKQINDQGWIEFLICLISFIALIYKIREYYNSKNQQNQSINQQQRMNEQLNINQDSKNKYQQIQGIDIQDQLKKKEFREIHELQFCQQECYICLETLSDKDNVYQLKCGHIFHVNCLNLWIKKHISCPIDRMIILEQPFLLKLD